MTGVNLSSPETQEAISNLSSMGMDAPVSWVNPLESVSTPVATPLTPDVPVSLWEMPQNEISNTSILSTTPLAETPPTTDNPPPASDIDTTSLFWGIGATSSVEPPKVDEWTQSNTMDMWILSNESEKSAAETEKVTSSTSPLSSGTDALYGLASISWFMAADAWDVLEKSKEILKKSLDELKAIVGELEANKAEKMKIIEEAKSQEKDAREKVKKLEWELASVEAMIELFNAQLNKEHPDNENAMNASEEHSSIHKKARKVEK